MKQIYLVVFLAFALVSCGESEKERVERIRQDSVHRADSIMKPRKAMYDLGIAAVKKLLKVPSTAKFAAITLVNTDTAAIFTDSGTVTVRGEYDAQNPMGAYLHDKFQVRLQQGPKGDWIVPIPDMDVNPAWHGDVLNNRRRVLPPYTGAPRPWSPEDMQ